MTSTWRRRAGASLLALTLPLASLSFAAASPAAAAEPATDWSNYEKILLTKTVGEPMDLAVMPDRRVLHSARNGAVRLTDSSTGVTRTVNTIPVYANSEDGLQTVTLDPQFETNKWVYLYYAPVTMTGLSQSGTPFPTTTPTGSAPETLPQGQDASYWDRWKGYNQLSRFKWDDATESLDLASEQVILKVETNRGQCCHVGGDVDFDGEGNLYLVTGDNTPASAPGSNGYAPNNSAPGVNPGMDARRGAGSTNDLRGKVLRITVQADGNYTVPAGNLFAPGTPKTRPEIFVMGLRNPFRFEVDPQTRSVSWGDYGPDAGTPDARRGPLGYVEWQTTSIDRPLNAGWPFCTGDQFNYNEWDFATATPGAWFDCAAGARNNSPGNTGLTTLLPAVAPTLYYGDNATHQPAAWSLLTELGGEGQAPMGGPIYHYDESNPSTSKFPAHWDGKAFLGDFSQDYVVALGLAGPNGPVTSIEDFLPNAALATNGQPIWDNVMDMEFGPDGSLYVLEYGDGFFIQNPDAGLYRIDYALGNKSPQAAFTATPISSSSAPLTVAFDAGTSGDPEGGALTFEWDFDGNGAFDTTGATASHTYNTLGAFTARLRVTDPQGKTSLTSRQITVGNVAPTVNITAPANGGFFDWGQAIPFSVAVNDPEDGTTCAAAQSAWTFALGHNEHAHPESIGTACSGVVVTPQDAGHGETENVFGVFGVTYTDRGANGVAPASTDAQVVLNPKLLEAEQADVRTGVTVTDDDSASGLRKVTSFDPGDALAFHPVNLMNITSVRTRASGAGTLALRWGSATAEPFATVTVPAGAGWQSVQTALTAAPVGTGTLFVTSSGGVEVDSLTFEGAGVADVTPPTANVKLAPAAPTGQNGWYTGDVVVTIDGTDNAKIRFREYSLDGGTTWVRMPIRVGGFTLPGDFERPGFTPPPFTQTISTAGTTNLLYRTTDYSGLHSPVGSVTIKIDKTAPTLTLSGIAEGASLGDSTWVTPSWTVTDATSGAGTVTATLDGVAVSNGMPIRLTSLSLGEHVLTATARDLAGHTTTVTRTFTVSTSYADVDALIGQYLQAKTIKDSTAAGLRDRLSRAEAAADAGRTSQASAFLRQFVQRVENQVHATAARTVLVRDASALLAQLDA